MIAPFRTAAVSLLTGAGLIGLTTLWHDESSRGEQFAHRVHGRETPRFLPANPNLVPPAPLFAASEPSVPPSPAPHDHAIDVLIPDVAGVVPDASANLPPAPSAPPVRFVERGIETDRGPRIHFSGSSAATSEPWTDDAALRTRRVSRVFRPVHIDARALEPLLQTLLTPEIGSVALPPIADESESAGSAAPGNLVVVHDLPEALARIDALVGEVDRPATRVTVDACYVLVRRELSQAGAAAPPIASLLDTAGGSLPKVWETLHALGQTRVIAATQLQTHERGWVEWQVGRGEPAASSKPAEGFQLRLRPILSDSNHVRIELRQQTATPAAGGRPARTSLATEAFIHEGRTAVVGGFFIDPQTESLPPLPPDSKIVRRDAGRVPHETWREEAVLLLTPRFVTTPRVPYKSALVPPDRS